MSWRDEKVPVIDEDEYIKGYIKSELMNYYLYLYKWHELNDERTSLNCSVGGSIIQVSHGVSDGKSPQERAFMKSSELEEMQKIYEKRMDRIDRWIGVLTEKYYDIVLRYVIKNRCKNARMVGMELRLEENTIKKYAERAVSFISSRNSNIL